MPTLTIPDPSLILLLGLSGSGKSTFAARHFLPTEIISSDRTRALICDDESEQSVNSEAFGLIHHLARLRLQHQKLTTIDATNLQYRARRPFLRLARAARVPLIALVLDIPLAVCLTRNRQRVTRVVPDEIIAQQNLELIATRAHLPQEGFSAIIPLGQNDIEGLSLQRVTAQ